MRRKMLTILGWIIFIGFLISPLFIKVKIACMSQSGECPQEINSKLSNLNGKSLFTARRESNKILKASFIISDYSMQFKLPNVIYINTLIKKPAYIMFNRLTNKYYYIDETGLILSVSENSSGLPILAKDDVQYKIGDHLSSEELFALRLIKGVGVMFQTQVGAIQNDTLVVDLAGGIRVIFPMKEAESDILLGSLRLIYTKITSDYPGKFTQIDMRYKNPVLR